jgi:hypothetical protein
MPYALNALAYFLGCPGAFLPSLCMRTCSGITKQQSPMGHDAGYFAQLLHTSWAARGLLALTLHANLQRHRYHSTSQWLRVSHCIGVLLGLPGGFLALTLHAHVQQQEHGTRSTNTTCP